MGVYEEYTEAPYAEKVRIAAFHLANVHTYANNLADATAKVRQASGRLTRAQAERARQLAAQGWAALKDADFKARGLYNDAKERARLPATGYATTDVRVDDLDDVQGLSGLAAWRLASVIALSLAAATAVIGALAVIAAMATIGPFILAIAALFLAIGGLLAIANALTQPETTTTASGEVVTTPGVDPGQVVKAAASGLSAVALLAVAALGLVILGGRGRK